MTTEWEARCRSCGRRVHPLAACDVSRFGGGSYRRPGRWYRGQTCARCIEGAVVHIGVADGRFDYINHGGYHFNARDLVGALITLINRGYSDLDEQRWREMYPDNRWVPFDQFFPVLLDEVEKARARAAAEAERLRPVIREILDELDAQEG